MNPRTVAETLRVVRFESLKNCFGELTVSFLKISSSLASPHDVCRTDNPQTWDDRQADPVASHMLRPHCCCKAVVAVTERRSWDVVAEHNRLGCRGRVAEVVVL